ncbi:calcium homeostasis endoplasmic reticulum protein [Amborella trichopoda]|uniref:CID domain-containing protein n=1 Tax=Amborella trichopoda TaxID=13333 RepID=W1PIB7_AMBTC|nr:calcium homeostasis endoplasmic reticulum protein [Amborella trichopoda]ERN06855.1 hypothetical protein AMTR_s00005p00241450 [Amborella trichopoda]|eukprot:XP_006845180.1 calcium homeostasis endoplasmic reticulum protein [Amborella trichopoda]
MERPPHDYSGFAQQAQQSPFGLQQQHHFPQPSATNTNPYTPFPINHHLPVNNLPNPGALQFPPAFHRPPPLSHPPPHLPPYNLPPHPIPQQHQNIFPPPFFHPWDPPPPPTPPPADPELQKRIDKLSEYAAKNGPEFEAMIREKQQDNPGYAFLFGGEGHAYYRYMLWICTHPAPPNFNPTPLNPNLPPMHHRPAMGPAMHHTGPAGFLGPAGPGFFDQHRPPQLQGQPPQPFFEQIRGEFEQLPKAFKGLSGPLPSDVASELGGVLNNLTGTKESIKGAKIWFMQRSPFAPALAEALRDRVLTLDDSEKQLHIIYLANDILFDSLQRRMNPRELDNEALAFRPVLGAMLARIYHNPQNKDANQSRLKKILQFWASKEVYDDDTIYALDRDMTAGLPPSVIGPTKDPASSMEPSGLTGLPRGPSEGLAQWQPDQHRNSGLPSLEHEHKEPTGALPTSLPPTGPTSQFIPLTSQHFLNSSSFQSLQPRPQFSAPLSILPTKQLTMSQLTPPSAKVSDQAPPPYPLFPPGLIPGMVRKMQIGSGVPYSPCSPLDIPTVIPPSTASPSYILERVSKFFKEVGEVNPSEGPICKSGSPHHVNDVDEDEDEREIVVHKGGACIPPPPNLQMDLEAGSFVDGSVERSGSGRLGLGAPADPNEVSQYDGVYTSYRKQRSTNYHSSMSARAAAR